MSPNPFCCTSPCACEVISTRLLSWPNSATGLILFGLPITGTGMWLSGFENRLFLNPAAIIAFPMGGRAPLKTLTFRVPQDNTLRGTLLGYQGAWIDRIQPRPLFGEPGEVLSR